jgi:predicted DNA-binding transcriptional regulator YafY
MAIFTNMNRIDRLTAILIQLQTKKIVRAEEISDRFEISLRTVYRDVRALMEAGVPIGSEAGKGYFIVDGYHLPPVMFNQEEASAFLTAGKLVEKMTDDSIRKAYESALLKIKSVLNASEKDHLENLQSSIAVFRISDHPADFPNQYMAAIQKAISGRCVLSIVYFSSGKQERTTRLVEPIGVVYYSGRWHLIAWCRLRNGYRDFRIDMIQSLHDHGERFDPRSHFTLQEYFDSLAREHDDMQKVVIVFEASVSKYARNARYYYGFVSEEDLGDRCRMTFLAGNLRSFCRWLMMFGKAVHIEHPAELRDIMEELIEELSMHYSSLGVLR